ncbi:MAG: helix-turn-helix transcriptional regulator, partial [Eubacteriaceae bacterium]|nr:helix-turn-helix transcriptional regulator [Eubacteriaceae bacterium]
DRIKNALNYIRKNIDSKILVKDLAEATALSVEHFIKVFKNETGETPNMYITRTKMERAMVLLVTSATPVKTIALNLGYDDVSYFNRTFKRFAGITPQQYRDRHSQIKNQELYP